MLDAIKETKQFLGENHFSSLNIKYELVENKNELSITRNDNDIIIKYGQLCSLFRGLYLIKMKENEKSYHISFHKNFDYSGLMHDCSRNGVLTIESAKQLILISALFGLNRFFLYTEDVYEIDDEPYFGYLRGRYSKKELREIANYGDSFGVEVVPCIQTLSHLSQALRWDNFSSVKETNHTLLTGKEETYIFIEKMIKACSEAFTSKNIHIGMDEAYLLGLGKYLEKHGFTNRVNILKEHLLRVIELAKKYNFKPMMWSDMFFRLANNGEYYPKEPTLTKEVIDSIPKDLSLVYWDYYNTDKEYYKKMMKAHLLAGDNVWFAGGAWTWAGFSSGNRFSLSTMIPAMKAAKECDLSNILFTLWGDFGRECSYYSVLPALYTVRRIYDGETDIDKIKKEFKELLKIDYDSMMDLDIHNFVANNKGNNIKGNPRKTKAYYENGKRIKDPDIETTSRYKYEYYKKSEIKK